MNNWNNPVYFYITCTGGVNEKGEEINNVNNADNVENKKLGLDAGRMVDLGDENKNEEGNLEDESGINILKDEMKNENEEGDMLSMLKNMNSMPKIISPTENKGGLDFGF